MTVDIVSGLIVAAIVATVGSLWKWKRWPTLFLQWTGRQILTLSSDADSSHSKTIQRDTVWERHDPQWRVSPFEYTEHIRRHPQRFDEPTPVRGNRDEDGAWQFEVPIFIENTSESDSPAFTLLIHVQPPFRLIHVFDEYGNESGAQMSRVTTPEHFWGLAEMQRLTTTRPGDLK